MAPLPIDDLIDRPDHPVLQRAFDQLIDILCNNKNKGMAPVDAWYQRLIEETVPHGKCIRGMLFVNTYQTVEESLTAEKLELGALAFWMIEMTQALGLILDDFVDRSQTRRGRPCWHLRDGVGLMALYDVFHLEQGVYEVLRQRFKDHPHYLKMMELMHRVGLITIKGQCLDMLAEQDRISSELVYFEMIRAKTAYYTFAFPVQCALLLANIDDAQLYGQVEKAALKIGVIFQTQDDYLDCYGDPEVIGKIGTDITDGKCSWLYVTAMKSANESQRKVLEENYGKGAPGEAAEAKVKSVYDELHLEDRFNSFISEAFEDARNFLAECDFPFLSFDGIIAKIEGRRK